ncbi:SBBP repeat-containing protein [candidate division WOR-3 bacterium]|nr:SBBP repeat-containing protein [candidate division WOR-3 bacterium]
MKKILECFFSVTLLAFSLACSEEPPDEVWNKTFDGGYDDQAWSVEVDPSGNVYVVGFSYDGSWNNFRAIKYNQNGNVLWNETFGMPGSAKAYGTSIDGIGNLYLAGTVDVGVDIYCIAKIYPNGERDWYITKDVGDSEAHAIAVDASGFMYVTGHLLSGRTCTTWKLSPSGDDVWLVDFSDYDINRGFGIAVDQTGDIYVAGMGGAEANTDFLIVKYDSDGDFQWNENYDLSAEDTARDVVVDNAGYFCVTGTCSNGSDSDFLTLKYDTSGALEWSNQYDSGADDGGYGVAIDDKGNVYVTGYSHNGFDYDYLTLKYNSKGKLIWEKTFDSGVDDIGTGIAVDGDGYVYVTGYCGDASTEVYDFCTIRYE